MKVFEIHFKDNKEDIFDSFCYEPENIIEKKLGSLYMAGSLRKSNNTLLLSQIAKTIKEKYYASSSIASDQALKDSLKAANEFLEQLSQKGIDWAPGLNFSVMAISNSEINFTKVGGNKILLFRSNQIISIDDKLKFQEIEPYPLKIFSNIASGELANEDLVLMLTPAVFNFFQEHKLLKEISQLKTSGFSEKAMREIISRNHPKLSGVCLSVFLGEPVKFISAENLKPLKRANPLSFFKKLPSLNFQKISLPKISLTFKKTPFLNEKIFNKKILLVLYLIFFL